MSDGTERICLLFFKEEIFVKFRLQPSPGRGPRKRSRRGAVVYSFMFLVDKCEFLLTSSEFTFKKPSEKLFFENLLPSDCLITRQEEKKRRIDIEKCKAALITKSL